MIEKSPYKPGSIERGIQCLRGSYDIIPSEPVRVPLGERQLVMHREVLEDYWDCRRTVHPVEKHPANPLISAKAPWEDIGPTGNGSVLYDAELGKFRLWTQLWPHEGAKEEGGMRALYYESDDGLRWERPNLRQVPFAGSRNNNLFTLGPYLPAVVQVFCLPETHRARGCFGMLMAGPKLGPDPENDHKCDQFMAFSDDGYVWRLQDENPIFHGRCDSHQPVVWNPERQVFMYYRRATVNAKEIRRIAYSESRDLIRWTQPRLILGPDELDTVYLYGMTVTRYQNVYLGLLQSLYDHVEYDRIKVPKALEVDIQLAWSRDGIHWERHPERPIFIPTGPIRRGVPDWGMVYALNDIMDVGDRAHVYYCGCEGLHTSIVPEKARHLCLGTVRRDGFVSLDAPREGWALTAPLRCPGGRLHLNARTARDGVIQVAVREGEGVRDGEWPEAWSLDVATDFVGDALDHEVHWRGQQDLTPWKEKTIRLEFRLVRAELYSFWFA